LNIDRSNRDGKNTSVKKERGYNDIIFLEISHTKNSSQFPFQPKETVFTL